MTSPAISDRRLVPVGSGQIHCRIAGQGPPLLVIPAGNGPQAIAALVEGLSRRFTCILVDIPGYLLSDPLPEPRPAIRDYARAMAGLIEALELSRCAVLGSHTGATVAVELAAQRPDLCASLVLHELSLFSPEQRVEMLANHLPPYVPDWHGGYLIGFWHRYREQALFRPWFRKGAQNRVAAAGDDVHAVHDTFLVQAAVGDAYRQCYEAVIQHDTASTLRALSVPLLVAAPAESWLAPARALPGLAVELVPADRAAARYGRALARGKLPPARLRRSDDAAGERRLVTVDDRRLMVRCLGSGPGPAVLVLPHMPGPALPLAGFAAGLTGRRTVLVELSGNGDSAAPPLPPAIETWTDEVAGVIAALDLGKPVLVGQGAGAIVAAAAMERKLGSRLVLINPPLLSAADRAAQRERYAAPLELAWDGTHLVQLYQALRNEELFWPWYDQRPAATRRIAPALDRFALDRRLVGILKHHESYAPAWQALLDYPLLDVLRGLPARPVAVTARDHLFAEAAAAGAAALKLPTIEAGGTAEALALAVTQALRMPARRGKGAAAGTRRGSRGG